MMGDKNSRFLVVGPLSWLWDKCRVRTLTASCRCVPGILYAKMKIMRPLFFLCLVGSCGLVQAAIYKHIDVNGRVTYSTTPLKGAVRISTDLDEKKREAEVAEQAKQAVLALKNKQKNTAPLAGQTQVKSTNHTAGGDVCRVVDVATQKVRDTQRGRILAAELNGEIVLQQQTQNKLISERAAIPPNASRIKQLEEDLRVHDNNIRALQKEINRMK